MLSIFLHLGSWQEAPAQLLSKWHRHTETSNGSELERMSAQLRQEFDKHAGASWSVRQYTAMLQVSSWNGFAWISDGERTPATSGFNPHAASVWKHVLHGIRNRSTGPAFSTPHTLAPKKVAIIISKNVLRKKLQVKTKLHLTTHDHG